MPAAKTKPRRQNGPHPIQLELTAHERILFSGLLAREREIERELLAPLRADYITVSRDIEKRLGLPAGAIGTTHLVDMDTGQVVPRPKENGSTPA